MTIFPYKRKQNKILEATTSASRYPQKGRTPYNGYYVKPKTFATHPFTIDFLQQGFPDYEIIGATPYTEDPIYPFSFNSDISFTPIQSSFCEQMMKLSDNRIFCNLQTGYGKTFIMLYMISQIRKKSIVICYSTTVLNQWIKSLKNHTNFKMDRVMLITGSPKLHKISTGEIDISGIDIFLCTPTLIGSYADKYGWDAVAELFEKMHLGVKVYDEAHRNIKMLTIIDAFTNVKRNFYLSADYSQSNPEKRKLFFQTFFDVPIIRVDKKIEKSMRYIDAMVVNFNSKPRELDESQVNRPNYGFSNFEYMKYEFGKPDIVNALKAVLNSIINKNDEGKKILIATSMIEHVEYLYNSLKDEYAFYKPAKLYSELDPSEKQFALGQSNMIIATIGSFGPGIDVHGIRYVIAMDQFDNITDNQLAGRARPDNGKRAFYIMMNDAGFSYCIRKIERRLGYLSKTKLNGIFYVEI